MHNWTYWTQNLIEQSLLGYQNVLGLFLWPFIFSVVIGYIYLKNQSVTVAGIVILIFFASFGNVLMGVEPWYSFMHILVALIFSGLVLIFLTKVRR